jgi:hypothetical protein
LPTKRDIIPESGALSALVGLRLAAASSMTVEALYDEIGDKQEDLPLRVTLCDGRWSDDMAVTAVNERRVDAIALRLASTEQTHDCRTVTGQVDLKALSSHFARGINRVTVAAGSETTEVVLDVEM